MPKFAYSGNSNGKMIQGFINGDDSLDALTRLTRLGIVDPKLLDENEGRSMVSQVQAAAAANPIDPATKSVTDSITAVAKQAIRTSESLRAKTRRQSLLVGHEKDVRPRLEGLLNSRNGVVSQMTMHPDGHGKMVLAMIVEHDLEV